MIRRRTSHVRILQSINPEKGNYLTVSIPSEFCGMFKTGRATIDPLPGGVPGIIVRPARIVHDI